MVARLACLLMLGAILFAAPVRAAEHSCAFGVSGARPQPVPASLARVVIAAFGVRMTPAEVMRQGVVRCADGTVLACLAGANLNCGKADTSRHSTGGTRWCQDHPNAAFIPMFATGHATVYAWRCEGTAAVPERQVETPDIAGYVAEHWRALEPHSP